MKKFIKLISIFTLVFLSSMSVYAAESTSLSMEDLDTAIYEELLTEFYGVEEGYAYCSVAVNITSDTALTDTVTIGIPDAVGTNVWRVSTELTEDSNVSAVQFNNSYYYLYPVLNPEFTDEGVSFQTDKLGIFIAGGCLDDETLESFSSGASLFAIDNNAIWTDESGKAYYAADALVTWDISENEDGSVVAYLFDTDADTIGETVVLNGIGTTVDFNSRVFSDTEIMGNSGIHAINHRGFGYKNENATDYAAPWTLAEYKNNIKHFYITNTSNISFGNAAYLFYNLLNLESVDFSNASFSNVTSMYAMFKGCSSLTTLDLSSFDTSNVTTMWCMFNGCSSLTSLDVSNFNTSKVTNMEYMFEDCKALTTLNLSNFDTSNVFDIGSMFRDCSALTALNISNFNTSNVTNMSYMFYGCSSLTSLDVSRFNTSKVTNMYYMFEDCRALTTLDISNFNTSKVTKMSSMFSGCSSLTTLDVSNFNTSNVTDTSWMFSGCMSLTTLDLSNFDTSKVTDMNYMFSSCKSLTSLNISSFNTSKVNDMSSMFSGCSSLTTLDLSNFETSNVTNMRNMFNGCKALTTIDLSNFNTSKVINMQQMFSGCSALTTLEFNNFNTSKVTDMYSMFDGCSSLTSLDVSNFNTSNVTRMTFMFSGCSSLTSLDLSNFNTSKVTDIGWMFNGCSSLTTLDLSNFDTSNVTDMSYTFRGCKALEELKTPSTNPKEDIDLPTTMYTHPNNNSYINLPVTSGTSLELHNNPLDGEWLGAYYGLLDEDGDGVKETCYVYGTITDNTEINGSIYTSKPNYQTYGFYKVLNDHPDVTKAIINCSIGTRTSIRCLFDNCAQLVSLEFGTNFNTSRVTDMSSMFYNCNSLTTLDVSSFNTSNVNNMDSMFYNCKLLTLLDVSNFNTSKVTRMNDMFRGCSSLTTLNVSNFDTSKVTYMTCMFDGCSSLTALNISNFNTSRVTRMDDMFSGCSSLTTLNVSNFNTSNVTKMNSMFSDCSSLTSLDLSSFNASNVTNMSWMFDGCSSLTTLDISNLNTSNVTAMVSIFRDCSSLTTLDVSNFDTSNITNMEYMFSSCKALTTLNISNFNTSSVTNMYSMFSGCSSLTSLDLSNFDTSNVTNMGYMFYYCKSLTTLDLSNFNTSNVTDMAYMFSDCNKLTSLDLSGFNMSAVTKISSMFYNCKALETLKTPSTNSIEGISLYKTMYTWPGNTPYTKLPVTSGASLELHNCTRDGEWLGAYYSLLDKDGDGVKETCYVFGTITDTTKIYGPNYSSPKPNYQTYGFYKVLSEHPDVTKAIINCSLGERTNIGSLFAGCTKLVSLEFGTNFNTSNVTDMEYMFSRCSSLTSLYINNFNTSNVITMNGMFGDCSSLIDLDISSFDTSNVKQMYNMFDGCKSLVTLDVSNFNTSNVTSMQRMFFYCNSLTTLDVRNFNTSNVTNMRSMFSGCSAFTSLDLSNFDTSKVTNMSSMFYGCKALTTLDLSNFNTVNVTSMYDMFSNCSSLTTLDLSNFDTSNVTSMDSMFRYCSSLTSLDLSNFNTSEVTDMGYMFNGCKSLTTLDLRNFNTSNVTNMSSMFENCNALTSLDLSNFNTSNVTNMGFMFRDCSSLATLNLSNFDTSKVARMDYMFYNCRDLTSLDLSNFNTSRVTNMKCMFDGCQALTSLDISNFNTINITDMSYTFSNCKSLTTLDLSNFDTSNVTNMSNMFYNCCSLTILDVNNFDTSKATDILSMFRNCNSVTILDLSNFDTSKVTNMGYMFDGCNSLIQLDISSFNMSSVTGTTSMFSGCSALDKIVLPINIGTCSVNLPKTFYGYAADDTRPDKPQSYTVLPAADASTRLHYISGTEYIAIEALLKDAANEDYFLGVEHTSFKRKNIASVNFITNSTLTSSDTVEDAIQGILDVSLIGDAGVFAYSKASSNEGLYDIYVVTKYNKIYTNANADGGAKYLFKGLYNCDSITGIEYLDLSRSSTAEGMFSGYALNSIELPSTYYAHSENVDENGNSTSSTYSNNLKEVTNVSFPGAAKLEITITLQTESTSWDWVAIYPGDVTPTDTNYSEATVSNGKLGGSTKITKTFTYEGDSINILFRTDGSGNKYYGYYAVVTAYDADNNVLSTTVDLPKKVLDLSNLNLPSGINTTDFFTNCTNFRKLITPSTNTISNINLGSTMYSRPGAIAHTVLPVTSGESMTLWDTENDSYILNTQEDLFGELDENGILNITGTGTVLDKKLSDVLGEDCAMLHGLNFGTNTIEEICADWCNNQKDYVSGKVVKYFDNLAGTLVLPNNLKTIGDKAFYECSGFTGDLTIPNTVTSIGNYAFAYCKGFTGDLIIPDSVTIINSSVFYMCSFNGTLTLGNHLTAIGADAFSGCDFTGDLVIPSTVTTIGESAFDTCSFDGMLTLGAGLKIIGASAFESCNFTGDLILPDGLNSIGSQAFMGCTDFNGNLTIPDSVTTIGDYAFAYCIKLRGQLVIPSGLTKISAGVFSNCICFTGQLFIPDKITEIGNDAFNNCINIRDIKIGTYKKILKWYKDNSKLTSIGKNAFYSDYKILTSLDTKNSTAEGYDWAGSNRLFSGSTYTTYLNTAQDLTGTLNLSTGELVISGTGTNLDIPLVECIGMLPLSTFTWQTDTIETICDGWCSNEEYYIYQVEELNIYSNLSGSLILPNSIKSIGENAFLGCEGFSGKLGLPNSLVSIGARAFMGCEGLTGDLTIPDTVTSLGVYSFDFCSGLNGTLTIPDSVTSIDGAFAGCNNITNIVIGSGVESISDMSFACAIPFKDAMTVEPGESPLVKTPVNTVVTTSNKNVTSYDWAADMRNVTFIVDVPLSTTGDLMGHIDTSIGELSITGDGKDLDISLLDVFDETILRSIKTLNFEADKIETICNEWCCNLKLPNKEDGFIPNLSGTLNLPNTIKNIGTGAFGNCYGFTGNLVLPNSLETIGNYAFGNCYGFTGKIVLPDSVTTISDQAFIGCNNVTFIEIGNGVESIGVQAFACADVDLEAGGFVLVETPVPTRLKTRNEVALNYDWSRDMREITYVIQKYTLNKAADLFGYLDTETGEMSIEGTGTNLDKQLATVLNTTEDRAALKSLVFNTDTIENIGYEWCLNSHYDYDTKKTEQYFPNLTGALVLPNNLKIIGNYAFRGNPGFTSNLVIPDGVTTIGEYAFYGCNYLNGNLVIPNSVTTLGQYAFAYCYSFDGTLTLSSNLTVIEDDVFAGCTGLRGDLVVPDGVTSIGDRAFGGFDSDSRMFENGTLTLPDSVITIKSDAFDYCRFTGTLKLPKELVTIGDRAFNWTSFTSIEFNNKLTTIGGNAFNNCTYLNMDYLVIPDSVTTIKYGAFRDININKFYIGKNVETLGTNVFEKSSNYKTKLYTTSEAVKNYDWAGDNRTVVPMNTFTVTIPEEITLKPKYVAGSDAPIWYTSFNMEVTGDFENGSYGVYEKLSSFTIKTEDGETRTVTTNIEDATVNENGTITVPVELTAPDPTLLKEFTGELKLNTVLHEMIPFAA